MKHSVAGSVLPVILILGSSWTSVLSFKHMPLYFQEYRQNRKHVGHQGWSEHFAAEGKFWSLLGMKLFLVVAVPTALSLQKIKYSSS